MRSRLLIAAAAVAFFAGPVLADTKAGVEAWERGDYRTAVEEWKKAARTGDPDAQYNLGQAYKLGRGVPVDIAAAEGWYGKAAAQGHVEAEDSYGLALFQNNRPREAIPYLEKSVARDESRAQYILGTMLFNGTDIKKDWVRAYALTSRASAAGLPQATQSLRQMDEYLSVKDREQGRVLAQRMDTRPALPSEVTGRGNTTEPRSGDLPSSDVVTRPGSPTRPSARDIPPPVYVPSVGKPVVVRKTPSPPIASGRWRVQLGAFGDAGNARKLWGQVASRFQGRSVDYVKAGALTRVMVGPFASRAAAVAACGSLTPCVPVGP